MQLENSGTVAEFGSSKCVDDAGHNLCPLKEAAIASAVHRKENLRLLYRSTSAIDQAFVMTLVILR